MGDRSERPPGLGRRIAAAGYFVVLRLVRRQRVHTSDFVGTPLTSMTSGWRLGFMRRWARTRFIPDDCGLKPPIDTLPQIAQERAMVVLWRVELEGCGARRAPNGAVE